MAKAISDEELQLKKRARRRLVGAIALVLLVVVFLPMFLDSEPKPLNQDIAITIPPIPAPETPAPPSGPPAIAGLPQGTPEPAAKPAEPVPPSSPATSAPTRTETPAAEIKPSAKPESRPAAELKPVPKPESRPVTTAGDGYVVQLGAFSNSANAKALQKKLHENKFKAYTELVKSPGGDRTRVRVGPYASREAADKARDQLRSRKLIIGDATVVRQSD
jgi:DedD protein